jgi:hypothetical protein
VLLQKVKTELFSHILKKLDGILYQKSKCPVACLVFLVAVVGFEHMVAIDARVGLA